MSQPLISVAIPTYNGPDYLLQALVSVFAQTFCDYEVVVVNDGSTDDTAKRLEPFAGRIRVITQANSGIGAARNRAIDESRGKYVAPMDHDDWWMPEKLACQVGFLESRPECVGCTVPFAASRRPDQCGFDVNSVAGPDRIVHHPFAKLAAGHLFIMTSALMFDRQKAAGCRYGTVPDAIEDVPFHLKLLARGPFGIAGDRILAIWRQHEANFSRRPSYYYRGLKILREMDRHGEFAEVPPDQRHELEEYLAQQGRVTAMRQAIAGHRGAGLRTYFTEFPHQMRHGRLRFLTTYPLLLLPGGMLGRYFPT